MVAADTAPQGFRNAKIISDAEFNLIRQYDKQEAFVQNGLLERVRCRSLHAVQVVAGVCSHVCDLSSPRFAHHHRDAERACRMATAMATSS